MRNLELTSCLVLPASALLAGARCFCLDCDAAELWVATNDSLCCVKDHEALQAVSLVDEGHMTSEDRVVAMEFVPDLESVCVCLAGGDILLRNVASYHTENVGTVGGGVVAMAWSPEQDVVAIVTGERQLLLMTREFDPVVQTSLNPDDFGEAKPITVGWGKKETQFHGSEGKQRTGKSQEAGSKVNPAFPWDDCAPRISWRGDGEFFACSSIEPSTGGRRVRVWSRDCVLHSTSETLNGLEQALHWRPSGNLVASTQRSPKAHEVVFFERNGLQHGGFPLRSGRMGRVVREMQWSSGSDILALWLDQLPPEVGGTATADGETDQSVQLWSSSNYHWYLKQELRFPGSPDPAHTTPTDSAHGLVGMLWDPISPLKLHLLTSTGQYLCYSWCWQVAGSLSLSPHGSSPVAVIDGCRLLLTLFRHAVVPPPLCSFQLVTPSPVVQVTFAPEPRCCDDLLALLSSGEVAVFCHQQDADKTEPTVERDGEGFRRLSSPPVLCGIGRATGRFHLHSLRQLVWWKAGTLLAVANDNGGEAILEMKLDIDKTKNSLEISHSNSTPVPSPVQRLCSNPNTGTAVVQLITGDILKYDGGLLPWKLSSGLDFSLQEFPCDSMALAVFNGTECLVSRSNTRGSLFVNDRKVGVGVTSFGLHDEFLLFTTNTHTCRFLPLTFDPRDLEAPSHETASRTDEGVRQVERGSRIVAVVTHDVRLVLQMPRGNLETVCPRALVLARVRRQLDGGRFGEAFVAMRRHRINLNLLYDHCPARFLSHTGEMVRQLDSIAHINLFLTELKEEDVARSMYPGLAGSCDPPPAGEGVRVGGGEGGSKVDRVCDALRKALVAAGRSKYLLCVITTHVKKSQPELETVLAIVKALRERPPEAGRGLVTAEEALQYLLFLVDVNLLYNVALGMYDLPLTLMVAERSQKDPKEYLPFLNELRKLPQHYQRFRIDQFLRRFDKALEHISRCGEEKFPECLALVTQHSLFRQALDIFSDRSSLQYKAVAKAYADHLAQGNKHKEAGMMYVQCSGCEEKAMAAFEQSCAWPLLFSLCPQLQRSSELRMAAARRVANRLKAQSRFIEAARVLLDYAEDVEEGVATLVEGCGWWEGLRLAHLHSRTDLLETHLKPGLLEAHQSQLSLIETLHSSFLRHSARLAVVRGNQLRKQTAILEGTFAADDRDGDLFSDTSSVTGQSVVSSSAASKTSGRSSKTRRKAERKRHSLREGSQHEDLALLEALAEAVSTADRLQDEVGVLLEALLLYGFVAEGRQLQGSFSDLLSLVRREMETIWPPAVAPPQQGVMGPAATVNSILVAIASRPSPLLPSPVTSSSSRPPALRDNVSWKLDSFL